MRLLQLTLIGAVLALPAAISASTPADAARLCKCSQFNSLHCTQYTDCTELLVFANTFVPFRNTRTCRRSQAILCDLTACQVVCDAKN